MNGEEDFHVENTKETERFHKDICVLLLDSDATGLLNLSEMLRKCGYRVVATTRADDLPRIINNEKIDLVLPEFCLIEMNKYELLEKIKTLCEIPVVSTYVKDAVIFDCLYRGARFYLKKPFMDSYLEILWQFKVRRQEDFLSQIDSNLPEKKYSITHTQPLGYELKRDNQNNEVKTEDLDEYEGDNIQSGDQKKPELIGLEMQNEFRQTDDEHSKGNKRKERADTYTGEHTEKDCSSDLGDQKKPKLICADHLQNETLETIPNIEEVNNEREEPTETKKNGEGSEKEKPELVCMEEELEKWSTQPVTDIGAYVVYEFEERDFQPLESVGKSVDHREIPLSLRESSNKEAVGQLQMQNPHRALDEELMQDGISLSDLDFDLQEGQGSTSDLELLDEIFTDLANELKP